MSVFSNMASAFRDNPVLMRHLADPNNMATFFRLVRFELTLTQALKFPLTGSDLPVERIVFLKKIFEEILTDGKNWEIGVKLLDDWDTLKPVLRSMGGRGSLSTGRFELTIDEASEYEILKNFTIGLGKTQHRMLPFLRQAHNVHTFSLVTRNIDSFSSSVVKFVPERTRISVVVKVEDNLRDEVGSITDVTAYINDVYLKYGTSMDEGGNLVDLFVDGIDKVPITFDSKFVDSPHSLLDNSLINQQLKQFIGGRTEVMQQIFDRLQSSHFDLSPYEITEVIGDSFDQIFQHFVIIPNGYVVPSGVGEKFASEAKPLLRRTLTSNLEVNGVADTKAIEGFFIKLDTFVDEHFLTNNFLRNSEISHP